MQIILLERVENLGGLGDEVSVKNGFARNFLLPKGKALIANAQNRARFEAEREAIEKRNAEARDAASSAGTNLDGETFVLIRQSGATGQLYGSVNARDIVEVAGEAGHKIKREQVRLNAPIKTLGLHEVGIRLHAEVRVEITVNVARSADEAERQAAGENIIETLQAEQQAAADEQASEMAEAAAELDTAPEGDE
ncbi:MAG: 50S ribosomal protein L9 [Pseudomonadota bacterium]|jgi:large subunit ribosomal protein L9|nr:50S ribosomal protein L9 [Pseudomonadota bacterium]